MSEASARKLAAIFLNAPWLAAEGKAAHLPVAGMDKDHQVTWPELFALVAERDALLEALDNSQSLLVSILLEPRPVAEIEEQVVENRAALSPDASQREEG